MTVSPSALTMSPKHPALSIKRAFLQTPLNTIDKETSLVVPPSNVLDLLLERTGIREWQGGKELESALRNGKRDAYCAVLLCLLSNLNYLDICVPSDDSWLPWAIRKVASSDFVPLPLSSGFGSLREVHLHWLPKQGSRTSYDVSLKSIAAFFLLPCLDFLEISEIYPPKIREDFKWEGTYGSSSVTNLMIGDTSITLKEFEEFLSIPKALRYFQCVLCNPHPRSPGDVDYGAAELTALVKAKDVQSSLEYCCVNMREPSCARH